MSERLPVKTLQLEQMAVAGHAEEPSVVASRMRLVFNTLEVSLQLLTFFNVFPAYHTRMFVKMHP